MTSDSTTRAYAADARRFGVWCEQLGIEPSEDAARQWLDEQLGAGMARSSARRMLYALRACGVLGPVPIAAWLRASAHLVEQPRKRARPLWPQQVHDAVGQLVEAEQWNDAAALLVGFCGAMRRSEIARLRWSWVSFEPDEALVRLPSSKWRPEGRTICLPIGSVPFCPVWLLRRVELLRMHAGEHNEGALVFQRSDRSIDRLVKRIFGPSYSAHSLRSGWISSAGLLGAPEWQIAQHAGISDHETLRDYIREADLASGRVARQVLVQVITSAPRDAMVRKPW
jgi:integrase